MTGAHEDEIIRLRLLSAAHPNARILTHLAEAYRKAGDLARARETVERGLERHPEYPSAHVVLGRVLWDLGEAEGAERAFRRVLELDPENRVAAQWLEKLRDRASANGAAAAAASADPAPREDLSEPAGRVFESGSLREPVEAAPSAASAISAAPTGKAGEPSSLGAPVAAPAWLTHPGPEPAPGAAGRPVRAYFDALLAFRPADPPRAPDAAASVDPAADAADARAAAALRAPAAPSGGGPDMVALVDVLVGLLEYRDPFYRGGSSLARLIATAIGRELGLDEGALQELALAALLRDLGRLALGGRLIEKASVELEPEAKQRIEAHVDLALELLDGIGLPAGVRAAIRHHHERWDGDGYPDGLAGAAIPLPARILAVADSLAAMISPRPYRPPKRLAAAIAEIEAESGSNYDPAVVDALIRTLPDRIRRRSLDFGLRQHVIVVDGNRARALPLATRLCSHGYLAEAVAGADDARDRNRRFPADALLLSADMPGGVEPFLDALRDDEATATLPVVVLNADGVERRIRLLERGADLCFASHVAFDELRAALGALLKRTTAAAASVPASGAAAERATRWHTLQGDIQDFPLSWLLQVLNYDARTAAIVVRNGDETGTIYVEGGAATHAHTDEAVGDAALQALLRWSEGSFVVRPNERAAVRTVERSVMHLLLETAVEDDHAQTIFGAVRTED